MDKRIERDRKVKMEQLSDDISQVRLEMKVRRDPQSEQVYTVISKRKICRKLLLLKRITVEPEQVQITRLAASIFTSNEDDDMNKELDMIRDAGSYIINLQMDTTYDYKFEFRLNVRYIDLAKDHKIPFLFNEEEDSDLEDEQDKKKQSKINKDMKTKLKLWRRGKQANEMLDHLVLHKTRYSDLYKVSKLDLSHKSSKQSVHNAITF